LISAEALELRWRGVTFVGGQLARAPGLESLGGCDRELNALPNVAKTASIQLALC
jgi:hypothetical protein